MIKCGKDKTIFFYVTEDGEKHSMIWGMFMSVTMESAVFMTKNYLNNCHSIANTKDLTLKQMFDISTRLVSEQDERSLDWKQLVGKIIHGNTCLCLLKKESSIFNAQRSTSFRILCCVLVGYTRTPIERCMGKTDWDGSNHPEYRKFDRIDGEPRVEYFPRIQYVAAQWRNQKFTVQIRWDTREFHRKNYIHVNVQRHLLWIKRQWKRMHVKCQSRFSFCKEIWKRTMVIHWSWFWEWVVLYQWRKSTRRMGQYGGKDVIGIRRKRMSSFPCYKSIVERGRLKSKGNGKLSIHWTADLETMETIFRIIVSANQLSLYGAVAEMCEEYETLHDRSGQPVVGGQPSSSLALSVIKTEVPLDCDDLANTYLLLQQCGERIEKLSQQDKLSKFCMDAGFMNVVEIGQYIMTKDTAEFSQFHAVACREYTLPRDEKSSDPKRWIQGNTKIGPVLEVATCCLHGKYGVEVWISSVNGDNTRSWVRISHGSNKFVMNLNNNE